MREKMKTGSPFLFSLIRLLNFVFGLTAVTLFALSIWLWTQLNKFTFMEVGFLLLGLFEFFLVVLACTAQKSTGRYQFAHSVCGATYYSSVCCSSWS
jgi:uncharacterized Tic20 family protein